MNYHKITENDMLNGDGLRVTLWVAGCSHSCPNCQNPQTHDPESGKLFTEDTLMHLFKLLSQEHISGLTFSGGDPLFLHNRKAVTQIAAKIKLWFPEKTIWLYTGYKFEDVDHLPVMENIDVLVDGKYVEKLNTPSPKWRGSNNQRVINIQESISKSEIVLFKNS